MVPADCQSLCGWHIRHFHFPFWPSTALHWRCHEHFSEPCHVPLYQCLFTFVLTASSVAESAQDKLPTGGTNKVHLDLDLHLAWVEKKTLGLNQIRWSFVSSFFLQVQTRRWKSGWFKSKKANARTHTHTHTPSQRWNSLPPWAPLTRAALPTTLLWAAWCSGAEQTEWHP